MPIYAYRCENCGHAKDVLQKISDPVLTVCPVCGEAAFRKQVTAAGFQLKGSGWYVTDFRDKPAASKKAAGDNEAADKGNGNAVKTEGAAEAPKTDSGAPAAAAKSDSPPPAAPAPAPAPSGGKTD